MKIKRTATCLVLSVLVVQIAHSADETSTMQSKSMRAVKDSVITTKIKAKLTAENIAYAKDIMVVTDKNGVVGLSGTVATQDEIDKVTDIAQDIEDVNSVKNTIEVRPAQ